MEEILLDRELETPKLKTIEPIQGRWQFLWISVALSLVPMLVESWLVYSMLTIFIDISNGNSFAAFSLFKLAKLEETILIFYYVFFIASIVAVCMWVHRANKNMGSAGMKDIEQSPGMAVGWFFIPVANWFMPFNVMREIEKGSYSISKPNEYRTWKSNRTTPILFIWFFAHVVSSVLFIYLYYQTKVLESKGSSPDAMNMFMSLCYVYLIAYFVRIVSGIALIVYTRKITQFHNEHLELQKNLAYTPDQNTNPFENKNNLQP